MPKTFNQIYKTAKQKVYSDSSTAFLTLAMLNPVVNFSPTIQHNGIVDNGATTAEFVIQIAKRIKSKKVNKANERSTASALAVLDSFSTIEWESKGFATGELRAIGVKLGINSKYNADSLGEVEAKAISTETKNIAVNRIEDLINLIINNTTVSANIGTVASNDMFSSISDEVNKIQLIVDDYKHMSDKTIILMHPSLKTKIAKEHGTVFNNESPIYGTGLKSKFSINGIPVIEEPNLNKYDLGGTNDGTKRAGIIILDAESIALKKETIQKSVNIDLGLTKFVGTLFYDIMAIIDPTRIKVLSFDAKTLGVDLSKKVDA